MAFDTERAARRLTDAGLGERAANGVADVVGSATNGLATEKSLLATEASLRQGLAAVREDLLALKADLATARAEWKTEIEGLKFQLFAGLFAVTGIILAAMRLWM